jgi:hypothetical protein
MAEGLKESIATYTKGNGGRSKASKASQSQLNSLGVDYGGRFNYGKMYTFQYYTPKELNYDTNPIVLGLGPSVDGNELGLNLHYMPYNIRKNFLAKIWESYSNVINAQINGTNLGNPRNQAPLTGFNWTNLESAYGAYLNLEHCVHQYKIGRMRNMRMLGYEDWYIAAANDENRFYGKSIGEAQALYYNRDI